MLLSYKLMGKKMSSSAILSVRVSPEEKAMLQAAAENTRSTVSDFMRRKALEGAEEELMSRRVITIDADQWAAFEARLNEPAKDIPAVKELFERKPAWAD
jgi:uncharacterized protein (DUF1778 family)